MRIGREASNSKNAINSRNDRNSRDASKSRDDSNSKKSTTLQGHLQKRGTQQQLEPGTKGMPAAAEMLATSGTHT